MKEKQRKPETQTGIASFTMNDLAELVTIVSAEDWLTKPNQHDKARTNRTHKQRTK